MPRKNIKASKKLVSLLQDIANGYVPEGTIYSWTIINGLYGELRYVNDELVCSYENGVYSSTLSLTNLKILNSKVKLKSLRTFLPRDTIEVKKLMINHIPNVNIGDRLMVTSVSEDKKVITCGQNSFDIREIKLIDCFREEDVPEENFLA